MNIDRYPLVVKSNFLVFEFCSEGPKGKIKKTIHFQKVIMPRVNGSIYNLAFGDVRDNGKFDDLAVSDNKDPQKVLATVAHAVILFTEKRKNATIFAQGSTNARTRYYRMGITKHFSEISRSIEIWGAVNENEWELFQLNKPYQAFLAKRK